MPTLVLTLPAQLLVMIVVVMIVVVFNQELKKASRTHGERVVTAYLMIVIC